MTDDKYAQTETRLPLPPAPARHLPVQQPQIRYAQGVVMPAHEAALFHSAPTTTIEPVRAHPVDVRPVRRNTSHRARTQPRWWERWPTAYGLGFATGAVALFAFFLLMRVVSA